MLALELILLAGEAEFIVLCSITEAFGVGAEFALLFCRLLEACLEFGNFLLPGGECGGELLELELQDFSIFISQEQ